jgi:pimeloyl-ACP methyl ester carboxylesterase
MTSSPSSIVLDPPVVHTWTWRGYPITYATQGSQGPAIVLVHGFGASWGHWRKLMPLLAATCQVYAVDLIGFGASAKPTPEDAIAYTFETWGALVGDFCREVVQAPAVLVGNSIGCVVAMQTAVDHQEWVLGVTLINCSLRLLHDRRRATLPWARRTGAGVMQQMLGIRWLGRQFFQLIAKPRTVRKILLQAYAQPEAVTDDLVTMLMTPAADAGAADVFLAFTRYSQGPLPEDLLAVLPCPALILWGEEDPWEPIALGRNLAQFDCVEDFIVLPGAGHCPQDEVPEAIAPALLAWMRRGS